MAAYMKAHPRGRFGRIAYKLADFGLDADEIRERNYALRERELQALRDRAAIAQAQQAAIVASQARTPGESAATQLVTPTIPTAPPPPAP